MMRTSVATALLLFIGAVADESCDNAPVQGEEPDLGNDLNLLQTRLTVSSLEKEAGKHTTWSTKNDEGLTKGWSFRTKGWSLRQQKVGVFAQNGQPPCAPTCPPHEPSCTEIHSYTEAGGCAAGCTEDQKAMFRQAFCGGGNQDDNDDHASDHVDHEDSRPPCVRTCTHEPATCQEYQTYVAAGGCAASCDDRTKSFFHTLFCEANSTRPMAGGNAQAVDHDDGRPECARPCPAGTPTCQEYQTYIAAGGCMYASCDNATKSFFHTLFCEANSTRPMAGGNAQAVFISTGHWQKGPAVPPCAAKCPRDKAQPPTCADFEAYIGKGGCAASCSDALKKEFRGKYCAQAKFGGR